jgi:hypothetical protein
MFKDDVILEISAEFTTPLTMETRAFPKRWDKSRTSGGDILEDIID